jgi:hypothetical protein
MKEAVIKDLIADEDFSIFNDKVLALLEAVPEQRCDPGLGTTAEGGTSLWLKSARWKPNESSNAPGRPDRVTRCLVAAARW